MEGVRHRLNITHRHKIRARDGYAPDAKCLWWHSRSGCCPDRARHSPWHSLPGQSPQEALEKKAAAYAAAPSVIHFLLFQQLLLLQPLTLSILHNLSYNRYCNPLYLHRIFMEFTAAADFLFIIICTKLFSSAELLVRDVYTLL